MNNTIEIIGAKEHNLKNINVSIPKYKLVAITGPSGSGKSTLAMDILQKECQRQYMESMGLLTDGLNKPNVDKIIGLSPSISISQRAIGQNVRSTVGTYTEILTYLRILYAKLGVRVCLYCGERIQPDFNNIEETELNKEKISCPNCNKKLDRLTMASFSFNKASGACKTCGGTGIITDIDLTKVVDENLTIADGAFIFWNKEVFGDYYAGLFKRCASHYGFEFDINKKVKDYNELEKLVFYYGVDSEEFKKKFPNIKKPKKVNDGYIKGVATYMKEKANESNTKNIKNRKVTDSFIKKVCTECNGSRLNKESRNVTINDVTITELSSYDIEKLYSFILNLKASESAKIVVESVIKDLTKRLNNIIKIGLGYLSIDRAISTLSGGEAQRLKLSNIIDSGLTGVLYILDEPTTGLHPRDVSKLLSSLKKLRDLGNTILVIEHDTDFIYECDYVIDFGPFAGRHGGEVVAYGTPKEIMKNEKSVTGKYLRNNINIKLRKGEPTQFIRVINANEHNLKNINLEVPLNQFVCFTGVSGSGKSTLVFDVVYKYVVDGKANCDDIKGLDTIDKIIMIDQKPIGRQSRSNVATYTEVFTSIRGLYSNLADAKKKKLKPSDFSFNVKGGRCEKCGGLGVISLDMQFLDDVEITCPVCKGHRFKKKILEVKYKDKNISDILNMTIEENIEHFADVSEIKNRLENLVEVGLSYLKLGQSTNTLSGGECQRIKLSKELGRSANGHFLYMLDEPTTGLHPRDIEKIVELLYKLKSKGNSIWVIEHSLDVITNSEYIIDLGLEGGINGGNILFSGNINEILNIENSYTSKYIRRYLNK